MLYRKWVCAVCYSFSLRASCLRRCEVWISSPGRIWRRLGQKLLFHARKTSFFLPSFPPSWSVRIQTQTPGRPSGRLAKGNPAQRHPRTRNHGRNRGAPRGQNVSHNWKMDKPTLEKKGIFCALKELHGWMLEIL